MEKNGDQLIEDETEEVEEEESHLGVDWLATPAGTGGTCTKSGDSLPGAPTVTYSCCHKSRAVSLLSCCMMEPREMLCIYVVCLRDKQTPSKCSILEEFFFLSFSAGVIDIRLSKE